jgi:hypothetical protein
MEPELSVVMFRRKGWGAEDYHSWSDKELEKGEWRCWQLFYLSCPKRRSHSMGFSVRWGACMENVVL